MIPSKEHIIDILKSSLLSKHKIAVLLFGSYAKGNAKKDSDIDLAIKGSAPLDLSFWSQLEEEFRNSDIPQKIDLVDYHRVSPSFQRVIDRDGIRLL